MGIGQSSSGIVAGHGPSSSEQKFIRLYKALRDKVSDGTESETVTDEEFRGRFIHYFGGPCPHLGELLFQKLFSGAGTLNGETFISAMKDFERLSASDRSLHEAEKFYFYVFSQGKEKLSKDGLKEVIRVACVMALVVGSELHEKAVVPQDSPVIEAMVSSAMVIVGGVDDQELSAVQFAVWLKEHCPRLLEGINHWVETLLRDDHDHPETTTFHTSYHLPTPKLGDGATEEQICSVYIFVWALSTIVPPIYFGGHKSDKSASQSTYKHPVGGVWTRLYSSSSDGISMNRLQSHCFDYHEPSVMVLTTRGDGEGVENQFVVGVDKEWRDGNFFWGESDCFLLELRPSFSLLKTGAKLVSLNEKQRGFPTGLRFMSDQSYKSTLLFIDSSLEKGLKSDIPLQVEKIEVWGCGGEEAADSQKKVKEWESKEIHRRRKINKDDLKEAWQDSPDRYILEMGGVKVNNPKEQQQE